MRAYLQARCPDLVLLAHGNHSNRTHRRTFENFDAIAVAEVLRVPVCLNLDAKTVAMRPDLYMFFDEEDAAWKVQLLRFHRSQRERNLKSRGQGLDQRMLSVNRLAAIEATGTKPYAEVFEVRVYGR